MAHSQVVDALAADLVVVPVQFGSLLPDDESVVEDFLRPNEPRFLEYLESLDGRTQFNAAGDLPRGHRARRDRAGRPRDRGPAPAHP